MAEKPIAIVRRYLKENRTQVLVFVGGTALYLLLGLGLWWLLDWYIDPSNAENPSTAKKDLFQALGLIMAGLAGVIGIYFTWRNLRQIQESTRETLRLTEAGQITERFTRAIEQLGETDNDRKPKLEIRLGGIYALERIARDSPEDYLTVMEVLTAYCRQNVPSSPKEIEDTEHDVLYKRQKEPRADIRAIVHVIRRREEDRIPEKYRLPLDFSKTNLRGADLEGAYLGRAYLRYADLRGAYLPGVNFSEADLRYANLGGAYANLGGAKLGKAKLNGAKLNGAEKLTQQQLEQAIGDATTKLPEHLTMPASWTNHTDEQTDGDE